ncbi:MAG: TolB family protein, partial [Acidimicrobiales bacterium]
MTDVLRALLETRSATLADVEAGPASDRLLVASNLTGTMQLYELDGPGGELRPLTALPEPVSAASYVPGRRQVVFEMDRGGDERHQLYRLDLDGRDRPATPDDLEALTADPRHGHHLAGV